MTLDTIRLFCKKWIITINIFFCVVIVLVVYFTVRGAKKDLHLVSGSIESFENDNVRHNSQTVFRLKNYKAVFVKIKAIDNAISFSWFKWINFHKGDSVSFYVEEPLDQLAESQKPISVFGLYVNRQVKESVTESLINKLYDDKYLWIVPLFLLNLICFFMFIFPSFRKADIQKVITKNERALQGVFLIVVLVIFLWGIPWLLARYQHNLEGNSIYRILVTYWKFFLFLILVTTNFFLRKRIIQNNSLGELQN